MTREDIIRMAREAGISTGGHPMNPWSVYPSDLEHFAALPKRKPLTEEELSDVVSNETRGHLDRDTYTYALVCMIARAIERAHGIGGEE